MNSDDDKLSAEDRLIARYFAPLATHPGALGLSRRCRLHQAAAGLRPGAQDRRHHRRRAFLCRRRRADDVARKALRVNLSDLAAKGAKPLGFLLSLALPKEIGDDWLAGFRAKACATMPRPIGCPLFGGDTDRTPGPITDFHRHVRQRAGRHHGAPRRRQAGRPHFRQRHDRRCRARACACARAPTGN